MVPLTAGIEDWNWPFPGEANEDLVRLASIDKSEDKTEATA